MHKIKLSIEDLHVESFATAAAGSSFGTVRGHVGEDYADAGGDAEATAPPINTCNQTHCGGYSCEWTKCAGDGCKAGELDEAAANAWRIE